MKIKFIISSLLVVGTVVFSSCNDDFMQKDPTQELAEGSFLKNEGDLPIYLNQLYDLYAEGHKRGWADGRSAPFNLSGSDIIVWDQMSDNTVKSGNVDGRLDNSFKTPQEGTGTGWEWTNLRKVNYFLRHYREAEGSVANPSDLNKWAAEARFFKAWDYYKKIMMLGEVPWLEYDLNVDSPELYGPRTPRAELMDSVLWTINYAVEHIQKGDGNPTGRINKDMANFLKARICLFEGTFRKYHTELGLQSSANKFLEECVTACEAIIATGNYELYNTGGNPYWKLFTFKGTTVPHKEAILARVYDGKNLGHATQRYYEANDSRYSVGATKGLLEEYLCEDGRPIYIGGTEGSYTVNPLFKGYDGLWEELDNRDPRLRQTIAKPGEYVTIHNRDIGTTDINIVGIIYPGVGYNGGGVGGYGTTVTGYRYIKHWMDDVDERNAITNGQQTAIMFRYAEVLLMLAEAKAELGTINQGDLDRTINKLRERAGFNFVKYPTAKLTMGNIPADPRLDAIYASKLDYSVSALLREIRRERRIELVMEGLRYADLMRWKAGKLMTVPLRGLKFTAEKQKMFNGSLSNGVKNPVTGILETAGTSIINKDVFIDKDGFIIAYPRSPRITDGILPWDDMRYYWPIPLDELDLNKKLTQNPGWEDIPR